MVNGVSGYNYGYYNKNYNKVNKGLNDGACETASSIALKNSGVETASSIAFRGGSCETASSIALKDGGAETTSSIAFKAKPTQVLRNAGTKTKSAVANFPKKIVAFLAGALGIGVAVKASEAKTKTFDDILKQTDKLTIFNAKYPELSKVLNDYDIWTDPRDIDHEKPHYSKAAKLAIYESFEQNPQAAYILAKKLKHDESENLTPEILDAINTNYDELKKHVGYTLEQKYPRMQVVQQNPFMENIATLQYRYRESSFPMIIETHDLIKYSKVCSDKETADVLMEVLTKSLENHYVGKYSTAEKNIAKMEFLKKHPDMPSKLRQKILDTELTKETESVIEKYLSASNLSEFVDYVDKYGFDGADELLKYHTMAPKALRVAKSHCGKVEDVKNLTKKIIMTEELFDEIAKKESIEYQTPYPREGVLLKTILDSSRINLSDAPELEEFIKNMDIDKKNLYLRMVEDARSSSIGEMTKLLPVYMKYPDTQITNEMINKFNDPLARAMGLY